MTPVLASQPAGDRSHKPGVRLPLLSASLQCGLLVEWLGEELHSSRIPHQSHSLLVTVKINAA